MAPLGPEPFATPAMTWFRTKHVQITDLAEGSDSWAQTGIYADGEWHASTCLDTIPADSPTVLALGDARLVVPPAAWQVADSHTFTYVASTATRLWHVSIDIDRGTWWVWLVDQDARPWRHLDSLAIDVRLNDRVAHEALPLRTPPGQDDTVAYYAAGVAPMSCFSIDTLSVSRSPHGHDWWSSYVQLQGVYSLSDCRQAKGLGNVGARLRVGWTNLVVPVGGFKPAAHGWYTYAHQSNNITWWLSVHPRSGAFWAHMWSTAADISTASARVDISLQLSDQLGETHLQGQSLADAASYVVHGDVRQACPLLP